MADDLTGTTRPQIIAVRSSAGSGKTYRLARHYLKVLLASALYDAPLQTRMGNIVAITFTNKAAQEMRTRIIDWMKRIILDVPFENSTGKPLDEIMEDILQFPGGSKGSDAADPAGGARKVRDYLIEAMDRRFSELLSDFGHFNVGTIDSFVNLTLKASAMQLNLPPDFDVTTETQELIDAALDEVLRKTGEDPRVRAVFDRFLESYIDLEGDQADWVPKGSLASMITSLWKEEARENKDFFVPPESAYSAHRAARAEIAGTARRLLDSFSGQSDLRPHASVVKAIEKSLIEPLASSAYFHRSLEGCMTQKSCTPCDGDIALWEALIAGRRAYARILSISKCLPYLDVFALFKNIFTSEVLSRRRVIPIEELNRLLIAIMDRSDLVPEICYTLSEQYLHFLIDEFQDTSYLQWKNIEVLADEALGRGGSLFLVGDKKQAIYRWRGGRADLVDTVEEQYRSYVPQPLELDTNYRSGEHIVAFNNAVFRDENLAVLARAALKEYEEDDIQKVIGPYRASKQKFLETKRGAGYVSIEHLESKDIEEGSPEALTKEEAGAVVEERVRQIIGDIRSRGAFSEKDIAFLVRTREEARTIVEVLLSMDVSVESEFTVSVRNNPLVREIISLLKFIDRPDDDLSFASFITGRIFTLKNGTDRSAMVAWLTAKRVSGLPRPFYLDFRADHADLYDSGFRRFVDRSGYLPLYDLLVELIRHWEVLARFPDDVPYVLHFMEVVKDLEQQGVSTIKGLTDRISGGPLDREDDNIWLLNSPESLNAIKVLTIHKAKGLQFPVVILPFISLSSFGSLGGPDRQRFFESGSDGLTMRYLRKDYIEASPELTAIYRSKEREYLEDELNNLYVAMTRAEQELYILLTGRKGKKNHLREYLFAIPEFEAFTSGSRIVLGAKNSPSQANIPPAVPGAALSFADLTGGSKWALGIKTASSIAHGYGERSLQARKLGDTVHRALSLFDSLPADDSFITSMCRTAAAIEHATEIADHIAASLKKFFGNPAFRRFFETGPGVTAYNEKEIVDGRGNSFKLDRLIVRPDVIEIVDYKTGGTHLPQHAEQVTRYAGLVSALYPDKEVRKYILYIENGEVFEA